MQHDDSNPFSPQNIKPIGFDQPGDGKGSGQGRSQQIKPIGFDQNGDGGTAEETNAQDPNDSSESASGV